MRDLQHGRELQLLDRRAARASRVGCRFVFPQARVQLDELPHFAVGSPSLVAVPSSSKVEIRECVEATRRMEARGQLVRQSFILDEALLARCPNGLLIQTFGLEFPAVQASNLRAYQRGSVCEVLRTVLRPEREALVMFGQRPAMLPSLVRSCRIRRGRSRERCVEVVVGLFEQTVRRLEKRSCLRGRCDRLRVVACIKARLQLTNPIPAGGQTRDGLSSRCCSKRPSSNPSSQNEPNSGVSPLKVRMKPSCPITMSTTRAETRFLREFERRLGFALHLFEWICAGETIRDEIAVRIGCIRLVAGLQRGLQATAESTERPLEHAAPREYTATPQAKYTRALNRSRPFFSTRSRPSWPKRKPAR